MQMPRFRIRRMMIAVAAAAVVLKLVLGLLPLMWGRAYDAWVDSSNSADYVRRLFDW